MTAFAHPSLLDNRYAVIAETSAYTYDDDDLVNYAEFLRKHGRYKTKGGYIDSSRNIRSLQRQQAELESSRQQTTPSRGGLLAAISKSPLSAPPIGAKSRKTKASDESQSVSFSASANLENKKKEYEKQMKILEEEMIKAKQSEREAKRLEGDIKKEQRRLQYSLRDLDVDATRKRYNADRNLSKNLEEKDKIEREFVKKREKCVKSRSSETSKRISHTLRFSRMGRSLMKNRFHRLTKDRTDRLIDSLQNNKDKDRRNLLVCNDLAKQYRVKSNDLEVKHQQLHQVHSEFEQKIQQREIEENRIKKELADIATALNLEAQKVKMDMKEFLTIVDIDRSQTMKQDLEQESRIRHHEQDKHRPSGDITMQRSVFDFKQREALRRIGDAKSRLDTIYSKQRYLKTNAASMEQERRGAQLVSKITDIENRRSQLMNQHIRDRDEKVDNKENATAIRAKTSHIEIATKHHEDKLRDLETKIAKSEEAEYELRKSVKEAEFQRRKKEQEIQRLKEDLIRKKREDAKKIHEAIARSEQEERNIENTLSKEKTKLSKLQSRREDNYARLTRQREQMRENKTLLDTHKREHERLVQVQNQSQSLQSFNTI